MVGVRRVLVWLAASGLAGAGLAAFAPSAAPQTFTSDGTFTVPAGVCQVTIEAWGGGGGTSGGDGGFGVGGRIEAVFTVTAGQALSVVVGHPGDDGGSGLANGGTGFNTGGTNGTVGVNPGDGGGGGGSSAVTSGSTVLIVAGGGGGGGDVSDGGNGGVASASGAGSGQDSPTGGDAPANGGTAQGTRGNGGNADGNGGGGGAGANPGDGSTSAGPDSNSGGGGGGNLTTSTLGLTDPGSISGRDGQVIINAAAPGVGCPTTPAAAATPTSVTPRFTG